MIAEAIEHYVWCVECDEPHEFFEGKLVVHDATTACVAVERVEVDSLPPDWDRTYHAAYGDERQYVLVKKDADPNPEVHFPMYFLFRQEDANVEG